jgi:SNF2 family DNA or RNA helicase
MAKKRKKIQTVSKGWNTSDEDEINVRIKRAKKESPSIVNLYKRSKVFSSYELKGKSSNYLVELRSLTECINSCSCPDIEVNRLGTCKHIEAVKLLHVNSHAKNQKIEIFLDTRVDKISIKFPNRNKSNAFLIDDLKEYFSEDGTLLSEPTIAFASLKRHIENMKEEHKKKIKISALIEPWIENKKFELEKIENKKVFLTDYQNGKRSFELLKHSLFEYQKEGVLHLAFNERALLADDMGLGKTIQAIGASILLKNIKNIKKVLVVSPASLKAEWEDQIEKFTNQSSIFIYGNRKKREQLYEKDSFFYLANYEQILYDEDIINTILKPDIIILDEAQRIKNWQTKTANKIKRLKSRYAFVLTGTPIENRIDEIYSIVQFLNPKIFGPLFRFNRDFYKLDANGLAIGYKNMNLLHKRLKPIMLRRKKSDVEGDLPQRSIKTYLVQMGDSQQTRYDEYETMVSRLSQKAKKFPLAPEEMKRLQLGLSCMRILCDSAYILDQKITASPKIDEIIPIIEELLEDKSRKIIIFSEWEKMLQLLNFSLQKRDIQVAWHTGSFNQLQRREEIKRFKENINCNLFLSTDSGSVGLNLQVANVVINLDMPWNPAKLEQRIARAWRKHQKRSVQVINLITEDRLEHRIVEIVKQKQFLSDNVLDGLGQDELKLPSSRKEFLEDLDKIIQSNNTAVETKQKKNDAKSFSEDVVALLNDRVKAVSQSDATDTIFVIVDKKDDLLETKLNQITNNNLDKSSVTVLQSKEYELLKSLAKQGLIEIKDDLKKLYEKEQQDKVAIDAKNRAKIFSIFKAVKRKYEMAKLLQGGGFVNESIPVLQEMFQASLEILELLDEKYTDSDFMTNMQDKADVEIEYIVSNVDKYYAYVDKLIIDLGDTI